LPDEQLASGEIFPTKTKDSGDKLDEAAVQPKQKTLATNLTCLAASSSFPFPDLGNAYSWQNG